MYKIRSFLFLFFISCFSILLHAQQTENSGSVYIDFPCDQIEIHPARYDFGLLSILHSGKILISTIHDDLYYTDYQTEDGKVNISVYLSPEQEGTVVYFDLVNPNQLGEREDPDDISPYELDQDPLGCVNDVINTDTKDNRDPNIGSGLLSTNSAVATLSADGMRAEATIVLTITDQYAGDNYQVKASLDPSFTAGVETTTILEAWKRVYLEVDRMYTKGATVRAMASLNFSGGNQPEFFVDNNSDFTIGDKIFIFSPDGTFELECTVESKPANKLKVSGQGGPYNIAVDYGVRIDGQDETYPLEVTFSGPTNVNNGPVEGAFGILSNGLDGGAFVEFVEAPAGSENIPKITSFIDGDDFVLYSQSWLATSDLNQITKQKNRLHVISGLQWGTLRGTFAISQNLIGVFDSQFSTFVNDKNAAKLETLAHEIGHQYGLIPGLFPHIHEGVATTDLYKSHDCRDRGLMAYTRDFDDNGIAGFYIECLYHIRDHQDPFE